VGFGKKKGNTKTITTNEQRGRGNRNGPRGGGKRDPELELTAADSKMIRKQKRKTNASEEKRFDPSSGSDKPMAKDQGRRLKTKRGRRPTDLFKRPDAGHHGGLKKKKGVDIFHAWQETDLTVGGYRGGFPH